MTAPLTKAFIKRMPCVFLLACLMIGFIFFLPQHDFQQQLAQGDHGRDLYCFKKTFEGKIPYRDYWWQYGPLMPYYYSLFFRVLGVNIQAVIIGQLLLIYLSGVLIFLIARCVMSAPMALLASLWYWAFRPQFFYTYSHVGGCVLSLMILYCLLRYYRDSKDFFLYAGLGAVFILNLIRLNVGLSCFIAYVLCLFIGNRYQKSQRHFNQKSFALAVCVVLAVTTAVYFFLLQGISASALKQSFPYLASYRQDTSSPEYALSFLVKIVWKNFTATWNRKIFAALLLFAAGYIICKLRKSPNSEKYAREFKLPFLFLSIFLILNLHEYLLSSTIFRLTWVFPFCLLIFFLILETAFKQFPRILYIGLMIFLTFVSGRTLWDQYKDIQFYKQPVNLLHYGETRVYVDNLYLELSRSQKEKVSLTPYNPWIETVKFTLQFLENADDNRDKRPILAIPYDGLYYFLSGRDSAVYPLAFFGYINISSEDEKNMIRQMEEKGVQWVLLSSRANSTETALGTFGKDYCPLLAQYLSENFFLKGVVGDWQNPPGFTEGHGIKILKRK